jgi:hypothetical protein
MLMPMQHAEHARTAQTTIVTIPTDRIVDWDSFHDVFGQTLGFPAFYGRNLDAWIDCLTYADDRASGMTAIPVEPGSLLTLAIGQAPAFKARCPEQYNALVECTAFVNFRRQEHGGTAVLALLLEGHFA